MKARHKVAVPATAAAIFLLYLFMVANGRSTYMEASPASAPGSSSAVLGTALEYRQ